MFGLSHINLPQRAVVTHTLSTPLSTWRIRLLKNLCLLHSVIALVCYTAASPCTVDTPYLPLLNVSSSHLHFRFGSSSRGLTTDWIRDKDISYSQDQATCIQLARLVACITASKPHSQELKQSESGNEATLQPKQNCCFSEVLGYSEN